MEINFLWLGIILEIIGIGSFVSVLVIWLFRLYPMRKRFLFQLKKEFSLEYQKGVLTVKESKLSGSYQGYAVAINPFVDGGNSWVLLKCPNSKGFRAGIKPRESLKILRDPLLFPWRRRELLTGNAEFDKKFRVITATDFSADKILSFSVQEKLLSLSKKGKFEIQILRDGIFLTLEKELWDVDSVNFIFDALVMIAKNLGE